jgi:hypothetical protein
MSDEIELKFRHVSGDIGPLKVAGSCSVLQVKERLFAAWPKGEKLNIGTRLHSIAVDVKAASVSHVLVVSVYDPNFL